MRERLLPSTVPEKGIVHEGIPYQPGNLVQDLHKVTTVLWDQMQLKLGEKKRHEAGSIQKIGQYIDVGALPLAWDLMQQLQPAPQGPETPGILENILETTHNIHTGKRFFYVNTSFQDSASDHFGTDGNTFAQNRGGLLDSKVQPKLPQELQPLEYTPVINGIYGIIQLENECRESVMERDILAKSMHKLQDELFETAKEWFQTNPRKQECELEIKVNNEDDGMRVIYISRQQLQNYHDSSGHISSRGGQRNFTQSLEDKVFMRPVERLRAARQQTIDLIAKTIEPDYDKNGVAILDPPCYDNLALISVASALAYLNAHETHDGGVVDYSSKYAEQLQHILRDSPDYLAHHPDQGLVKISADNINFVIERQGTRREKRSVSMFASIDGHQEENSTGINIINISEDSGTRSTTHATLQRILGPAADFSSYAGGQLASNRLSFCSDVGTMYLGEWDRIPKLEQGVRSRFLNEYLKNDLYPHLSGMWELCLKKPSDFMNIGNNHGSPHRLAEAESTIGAGIVVRIAKKLYLEDPASSQAELAMLDIDQNSFVELIRQHIINTVDKADSDFISRIDNAEHYQNLLEYYLIALSNYTKNVFGSETLPADILDDGIIGSLMSKIDELLESRSDSEN